MTPARLELDYVAPPRRAAWPGLLLLAASLAVAAHVLLSHRDAERELAKIEFTVDRSGARSQARSRPRDRIEEESRGADSVRRQLALPWATLIETIESVATADVALLQLQPDAKQRLLRLSAEARHRDAMFDYLRRLASAPAFAEVHLVSHQMLLEGPRGPVQFTVQAALRSAP